jgi:hypothetical protein
MLEPFQGPTLGKLNIKSGYKIKYSLNLRDFEHKNNFDLCVF